MQAAKERIGMLIKQKIQTNNKSSSTSILPATKTLITQKLITTKINKSNFISTSVMGGGTLIKPAAIRITTNFITSTSLPLTPKNDTMGEIQKIGTTEKMVAETMVAMETTTAAPKQVPTARMAKKTITTKPKKSTKQIHNYTGNVATKRAGTPRPTNMNTKGTTTNTTTKTRKTNRKKPTNTPITKTITTTTKGTTTYTRAPHTKRNPPPITTNNNEGNEYRIRYDADNEEYKEESPTNNNEGEGDNNK